MNVLLGDVTKAVLLTILRFQKGCKSLCQNMTGSGAGFSVQPVRVKFDRQTVSEF